MKKNIILAVSLLGLFGCKNSDTGLQKNVLNTAYSQCYKNLSSLVKSPSSLRIKKAEAITYEPSAEDVYRLFGERLVKNNEISPAQKIAKIRFRGLGIVYDYEAQNSFGVFLPGNFECNFLYSLIGEDESPSALILSNIRNDKEDVESSKLITTFENSSNIRLENTFDRILDTTKSRKFTNDDLKMYSKILELNKEPHSRQPNMGVALDALNEPN